MLRKDSPPYMAEPKVNELMEKIVSLCKRRGFIFQSSEVYGGLNGFWDYGPLGAELKRNVKEYWWRCMTQQRDDVVGLDASIIMHPKVWEASGHTSTFSDPMVDCLGCKKRFRADQIEAQSGIVFHYSGAAERSNLEVLSKALAGDESTQKKIGDQIEVIKLAQELVANESDPQTRARAHKLKDDAENLMEPLQSRELFSVLVLAGKSEISAAKKATQYYQQRQIKDPVLDKPRIEQIENATQYCNECGSQLTEPRHFNLMFKTYVGPVENPDSVAYLRPETAQAIFVQFKNILEVSRQKVPFGIAQIGKAFRNEINPRNYTFRSREFEQMELEFFIRPDQAIEAITGSVAKASDLPSTIGDPQSNWGWEAWHKYWVEERIRFYEAIGLPRNSLVEYWQKPEELAHYARATVDLLFKFPFSKRDDKGELAGEELEGIAARGDFDLSQHERFSGKPMTYFDEELKVAWGKLDDARKQDLWQRYYDGRFKYLTKLGVSADQSAKDAKEDADGLAKGSYIPHVIEPSAGVDRLVLALICQAYREDQAPDDKGNQETRVVMKFHPRIAPIKVAVLPLLKNRPELVTKAKEVRDLLRPHLTVYYDEAGAIGRRYRRQDEAGTPFGVTIDFDTLGEQSQELKDTVTLRDRDTMKQERVKIGELLPLLLQKIR